MKHVEWWILANCEWQTTTWLNSCKSSLFIGTLFIYFIASCFAFIIIFFLAISIPTFSSLLQFLPVGLTASPKVIPFLPTDLLASLTFPTLIS